MLSYIEAKRLLTEGQYDKCIDYFKENRCILEYAYCEIMMNRLLVAKHELKKIAENDIRADWALKLVAIIQKRVNGLPTYFQLRNFLEIDLNMLLLAKRPEFIENIINTSDYLAEVNPETYKFIARVMYNNDFIDVAMYYLIKAKNKLYKDPEAHLILAKCYEKTNEKELALKSINACLQILPEYFPAEKMKKRLINV